MSEQLAEIDKIADNPAKPTFDNTLVALEKSGQTLHRVEMVFNDVFAANSDDALNKVNEDMAPKLAAHQRRDLSQRASCSSASRRCTTSATRSSSIPSRQRLLDVVLQRLRAPWRQAVRCRQGQAQGAQRAASPGCSSQFVNKLLAATKAGALVVDDKAKLDGLSQGEIDAAAQAAKARGLDGKWVLPLQNTTQQPALAELTDRAVRKQLFENSYMRTEQGGPNDTRKTIAELAKVRAEKAKLLGYPNYAAWKLEDQMAKTPGDGARSSCARWCRRPWPRPATRPASCSRPDRQERQALQAPGLGLGVLRREAAQGQVRPRPGPGQAVLRAGQRAQERRVLRRPRAVRPDLQGAARTSRSTTRT